MALRVAGIGGCGAWLKHPDGPGAGYWAQG